MGGANEGGKTHFYRLEPTQAVKTLPPSGFTADHRRPFGRPGIDDEILSRLRAARYGIPLYLSVGLRPTAAVDLAQQPVQAALDLGLPAERFIAGPRRLIPPLFDHYPDLRLQLLSRLEAVSCTG